MAWQEVTPVAKSNSVKRGVRFSISERLGVIVSISVAVQQSLGWKGKQQLKVFVGGGESSGKLRLAPDPLGVVAATAIAKGGLKCMLLRVPGLSEAPLKRQLCAFEVDGKALIVILPEAALPPVAMPRQPPVPGRSIDVTQRIAGADGHGGR